jgi:hypothetical protein
MKLADLSDKDRNLLKAGKGQPPKRATRTGGVRQQDKMSATRTAKDLTTLVCTVCGVSMTTGGLMVATVPERHMEVEHGGGRLALLLERTDA